MKVRIDADNLKDFIIEVLVGQGADLVQSEIFASALAWSDLVGRTSHGVWRLSHYLKRFSLGLIKCPCHPSICQTGESTLTVDGDCGFGQYLGHIGMEHAVALARESGVGVVTVRNSNHFGSAGYFVDMAARQGMFGIATSNSYAKLAAPGGNSPVYGTNPIAFGTPLKDDEPIILDMATAAVAGSTIMQAAEKGLTLPEGILVDRLGNSVIDPSLAGEASMLPFGGYKGGGIALIVEILSAVLTGAALSTDVRSMFKNFSGNGDNGHCFIALDIEHLLPMGDYFDQMDLLLDRIRSSSSRAGESVRLPGEQRWSTMRKQAVSGIELEPNVLASLRELANQYDVALRLK